MHPALMFLDTNARRLGPPGIIRKLKEGWRIATTVTGQKRKATTTKACREVYNSKTKNRRR